MQSMKSTTPALLGRDVTSYNAYVEIQIIPVGFQHLGKFSMAWCQHFKANDEEMMNPIMEQAVIRSSNVNQIESL